MNGGEEKSVKPPSPSTAHLYGRKVIWAVALVFVVMVFEHKEGVKNWKVDGIKPAMVR